MSIKLALAAGLVAGGATAAMAGTPMEAVKAFYDNIGLELDPAAQDRFVEPALSVIAGNQALRQSGQGECLDPRMPLDGADLNAAEIGKSLKMAEAVKDDTAKVVVAFLAAGQPHRLEWKLRKVGDDWKVSDIISVSGEWALSQYGCQ